MSTMMLFAYAAPLLKMTWLSVQLLPVNAPIVQSFSGVAPAFAELILDGLDNRAFELQVLIVPALPVVAEKAGSGRSDPGRS